jgi:CRISPR/Cas system-associated endonuclease Cas1
MGSVESIELSLLANSAVSSLKNKVTVPRDSGHVLYLNEPGLVVHKSGDTLLVKRDGNILRQLPIKLIDQVVSISAVQWSGSAMAAMLSRGIPIHFLTVRGRFLGELRPGYLKNSLLRVAQVRVLDTPRSWNWRKHLSLAR